MKAVLISIQPKWVELIASGKKRIEVRKTRPKLKTPFKCYIYETATKYKKGTGIFAYGVELQGTAHGRGKVIGEFVCKGMMRPMGNLNIMARESCLTVEELLNYSNGKTLYGWRISDLKIYDEPKELREFKTKAKCKDAPHFGICSESCGIAENGECDGREYISRLTRPPQSWCYVEVKDGLE